MLQDVKKDRAGGVKGRFFGKLSLVKPKKLLKNIKPVIFLSIHFYLPLAIRWWLCMRPVATFRHLLHVHAVYLGYVCHMNLITHIYYGLEAINLLVFVTKTDSFVFSYEIKLDIIWAKVFRALLICWIYDQNLVNGIKFKLILEWCGTC